VRDRAENCAVAPVFRVKRRLEAGIELAVQVRSESKAEQKQKKARVMQITRD